MLADAGANDRFTLNNLVQALENVMGLDEIAAAVVIEGVIFLQAGDVLQPR